jgi:aminopeptidase N
MLFIEHAYGRDAFVAALDESRRKVLEFEAKNPGYRVIHDNLADMSKVLSSHTYQKGAWTLHMLRGLVGDEAFWSAGRAYYRRYGGGSARTADFERCLEDASGRKLGWVFDQWLRRGGVPEVRAVWDFDAASRKLRVEVTQSSYGPPLRLPLQIAIEDENGAVRREQVELGDTRAFFALDAAARPRAIVLDPDTWVLMTALVAAR